MAHVLKILLIDDEILKLDLMREWLTGYYCQIEYATSYENAVDKLGNKYDLVVCDYWLHNGDTKNPGTGKMFKDSYCRLHGDTIFILYSGDKNSISDRSTRVECLEYSEDCLKRAMLAKIEILSQPKTEDEKMVHASERTNDEMQKSKIKMPLGIIIPLVIMCAGIISVWAVNDYRLDLTESKIVTHCTDDTIYREKLAIKLEEGRIATVRLEEQTKALKEAVDALIRELKRNR